MNPTSYAYQWERCNGTGGECKEISGATSSKYTPVEADVEHTLVAKVTAKNSEGEASASSKATGKVRAIGVITEYSLPSGSRPWGIAAGPDGNVWFTDYGTSKIGKITTAGTITEYSLPSESYPSGIASGPDGNLWFTDYGTSKIGKITTAGTITEYSLPSGSGPWDIASGPGGNCGSPLPDGQGWQDHDCGRDHRIRAAKRRYPYGIASGPDGNLWFIVLGTGKIDKMTTAGSDHRICAALRQHT